MYDTTSWVTDTWFMKWNWQDLVELHGLRPTWYWKLAFCTNAFFHVCVAICSILEGWTQVTLQFQPSQESAIHKVSWFSVCSLCGLIDKYVTLIIKCKTVCFTKILCTNNEWIISGCLELMSCTDQPLRGAVLWLLWLCYDFSSRNFLLAKRF